MDIPALVAMALQADGWYLRSDIIWHKPNPMPESVQDRPTSSHEHVFLLTKKPTYFYDAEAVREDRSSDEDANTFRGGSYVGGQTDNQTLGKRTAVGNIKLRPSLPKGSFGGKTANQAQPAFRADYGSRSLRNVWTIATAPYAEAHFATFPPELAERCIKAGTSEHGACPTCGAPWARLVKKQTVREHGGTRDMDKTPLNVVRAGWRNGGPVSETSGWQPTCTCAPAEPVPCVVLDCFGGAGTVGLVADRLRRDALLIELNPAYVSMGKDRVLADAPMFAYVTTEQRSDNNKDARQTELSITC